MPGLAIGSTTFQQRAQLAAAVDPGRVEVLVRDGQQELPQQEDGERVAERPSGMISGHSVPVRSSVGPEQVHRDDDDLRRQHHHARDAEQGQRRGRGSATWPARTPPGTLDSSMKTVASTAYIRVLAS